MHKLKDDDSPPNVQVLHCKRSKGRPTLRGVHLGPFSNAGSLITGAELGRCGASGWGGETLNQRERHAQPSLWPIGTPHPQKKQGRLKKKKPHFLSKPIDKRLQGEAHFSESFAPSMEAHSGSVSSLTSRGSLLVPSPVLCPPQVSFFYLNKKSKVHFC